LEEAVLKLKNNSEAILILPSHLAHGLLGDGNKITPKAILVYKIKVIDIK
jgi:FKBP-type peptidyl-prolyl cis-trans isomerase